MVEKSNFTISNHLKVAKIERLVKFGRAGWYSLYSEPALPESKLFGKENLLNLAMSKLAGGVNSPIDKLRKEL
jgi:hypothetical protein